MRTPRYPIYVLSKGRAKMPKSASTFRMLMDDRIPFRVVIEPQDKDSYAEVVGEERLLVLPFSNLGQGGIPARNYIWQHAIRTGSVKHWILDDNLGETRRLYGDQRIPCNANIAFSVVEDFTDRYENVALSGMNYTKFVVPGSPPFFKNVHVYSCILIRNDLPYRWRGRYNEDTDLCLQVLSGGWCTLLVNAFMVTKATTMTMKGGNTDELYKDDGRLKMARSLERVWPGVVTVDRRFSRPQHVVNWRKFAGIPLRYAESFDRTAVPSADEYGMKLKEVRPVQNENLRKTLEQFNG